ncbi:hypothetical protein [Sphingomonas sp. 3-13AW]|uniref:hypothetical protein n=1 Tax=Sphingomonas sp. 3-13AW TaxID=3050450 RepID=UPI003BB7497C
MVVTVLKCLTVGSVIALAALMLWAGTPGELRWWGMAIPFGIWIIGPSVVPYLIARRQKAPPEIAGVMAAYLILSNGVAGAVYYQAFFVSHASTAGLAMVFAPLYQWIALAVVALSASIGLAWWERKRL